jgi:TolB-like protein/Tfp pilus assembly protein PilF
VSNQTGDPEWDYLCHGLAKGIVDCLARVSSMRVIAPASDSPLDGRTSEAQKMAQRLGAKAALIGSVAPRGSGLGVQFELLQMSDRSRLWCEQYHRMPGEMVGLAEEVAAKFLEKSRLEVTHEEWQRATRLHTQSDEAYQLYLRAQYTRRTERDADSTSALECFNQALDVDPAYPLPYVGVAQSYCAISGRVLPRNQAIAQARAAALKALELAPDLAEAHLALALIKAGHDWDWAEAESAFQRALELKPSDARTRMEYGLYLVQTGRADEASAELQRGQQLDPISPAAAVCAVWPLLRVPPSLRRCEVAIERLKRVVEEWPSFVPAWVLLGTGYAMLDRSPEALAAFHIALSHEGDNPEALMRLAYTHGRQGDRHAAEELIANTCQRLPGPVDAVFLAIAHAGMGAEDQAFAVLEGGYQVRDPALAQLKAEPMLDSLRGDPRFSDLLERVGLRVCARPLP